MTDTYPTRPIVIDTREQTPWSFNPELVTIEHRALDQGDYTLNELESFIVIERKELGDFVACCGRERERFENELARLQSFVRHPYVVVEASLDKIARGEFLGFMEPTAIIGSIAAWTLDFGVHFVFGHDRLHSAAFAMRLLKKAEERYDETMLARRKRQK